MSKRAVDKDVDTKDASVISIAWRLHVMKETIIPAESQIKRLGSYLSSTESPSDQPILMRTVLWIWRVLLLRRADHSATRQMARNKSPRWLLARIVLCLIFVGPDLAAPFMASQTAWAAPAHLAHQTSPTTHLLSQRPGVSTHADADPQCPTVNGQNPTFDQTSNSCSFTPTDTTFQCQDPYIGPPGGPCQDFLPTCPPVGGQNPTYTAENDSCSYTPSDGKTCATGYTLSNGTCNANNISGGGSGSGGGGGGGGGSNFGQDIKNTFKGIGDLFKEIFQIIGALFKYDFAGWIACFLTKGTIPCPTVSGTPWSFDCPVTGTLDPKTHRVNIAGGDGKTIYQVASANAARNDSKADWLSGDSTAALAASANPAKEPGHLIYTYAADTYQRPAIQKLSSLSLGLGILMIGPLFALAGFQLLLSSLKLGSEKGMANAIEALGRVLLAAAIVGLSYYVVQMLFSLLNTANAAVVALHVDLPYSSSQTTINGKGAVSFSAPGDSAESFRGVVMPMGLWGCVMDDFIGLMASRLANAFGGMIPLLANGLLGFTGRITEIKELVNDLGEFGLLILSVTIWGQMIARIILINYYIIMAPVAFACWGLPGNLGIQTVKAWFKGLLQLLFMQTLQIFILTTMPSLLPDFGKMQFPQGGLPGPMLQNVLVQLPPIIVTMAAVSAPKVLMGMGPMNTVAKAGAIAGKAVAAAGLAASQMVKKQ